MKKYFLFFCLLACLGLRAQHISNTWLSGFDEYPGRLAAHNILRFGGGTPYADTLRFAFNFESTMAAVSDKKGLLFYTNGCAVANRAHRIMPNGTGLSPGSLSDQVCDRRGHIVPTGMMALPLPGSGTRYYLVHLGAKYDPVRKLTYGPLYFSEIDMTLDGGMGDVRRKNEVLLEGDLGHFTAVRHGNGRDWWLIVPFHGGSEWQVLELSPKGFRALPRQYMPSGWPACEKHAQLCADAKGEKLALWGDCKIGLFHFDRCAGRVSASAELFPPVSHILLGGGTAFSASGRYLYATSQNVLYRADLQSADPQLDTVRFSYDPYLLSEFDVPGNTFHYLQTGPDGKVYGNIPSRASYLHVLDNTDGATRADVMYTAQGLKLPATSVRTLPNIPNHRLGDLNGSPCDTLGINALFEPQREAFALALAPNPASGHLDIQSETPLAAVQVFDLAGREVLRMDNPRNRLDISVLPRGSYLLKAYNAQGQFVGKRFVVGE